ncbi:MAG: hypothetical protein AAGE18_16395 [Pseudomonadota bacterium]
MTVFDFGKRAPPDWAEDQAIPEDVRADALKVWQMNREFGDRNGATALFVMFAAVAAAGALGGLSSRLLGLDGDVVGPGIIALGVAFLLFTKRGRYLLFEGKRLDAERDALKERIEAAGYV